MRDKKGNSNTDERIALIKRFLKQFGKENIEGILADREFVLHLTLGACLSLIYTWWDGFIGSKWLKFLNKEEIVFFIRIKKDAKVPSSKGKNTQVHRLFRYLKVGESTYLTESRMMTGLLLSVLRLKDGQLLIVASNKNQ